MVFAVKDELLPGFAGDRREASSHREAPVLLSADVPVPAPLRLAPLSYRTRCLQA